MNGKMIEEIEGKTETARGEEGFTDGRREEHLAFNVLLWSVGIFLSLYHLLFPRLFGLYLYLHHRIHSAARPLKILCHVGTREMLLGWVRTK